MIATHLADASAWAELHRNDVAARVVSLLVGGGAATCRITDLEVLSGFDDPAERAEVADERSLFPLVRIDDEVLARAVEVQGLVTGDRVRPDALVVAAAAERAGLVLLHNDDVYERIAAATGQAVERVL